MTPSPEQSAYNSWLLSGTGSCLLEACAGGGKTTTLVEALKLLPGRDPSDPFSFAPSVSFMAFNKSIADTLKARCPSTVNCTTFHSHGFRALKASGKLPTKLPRDFVDSGKVRKLVFNAIGNVEDAKSIIKLVGLLKSINPHDPDFISSPIATASRLITHHQLEFEEPKAAVVTAISVLRDCVRNLDSIDFDDMLWLPVLFNCPFDPQDYVFVDEAQDTNDIQLEILDRMKTPSTRFTFVGDRYQAIYGFRGANADSMDKIKTRFNCTTMPLSVSYRCSKAVIREVHKMLTSSRFE